MGGLPPRARRTGVAGAFALAERNTVPETFFFRNPGQLEAFARHALPERMRANRATRRIRILSAGCASGDEAFSIAILLRERAAELAGWNVELLGADVNERALTRAREGRFSRWALRETPPELRERWFAQDGAELVLDPSSRGAVRFERRNLCSDAAWPPEAAYDAIFFRNVLM
ncbi:MAG TPA: CheR family methyltransferase, partial [Sandaracinaceae bacterium]